MGNTRRETLAPPYKWSLLQSLLRTIESLSSNIVPDKEARNGLATAFCSVICRMLKYCTDETVFVETYIFRKPLKIEQSCAEHLRREYSFLLCFGTCSQVNPQITFCTHIFRAGEKKGQEGEKAKRTEFHLPST